MALETTFCGKYPQGLHQYPRDRFPSSESGIPLPRSRNQHNTRTAHVHRHAPTIVYSTTDANRFVKIIGSPSVIATVCSKCAASDPSAETTVQ